MQSNTPHPRTSSSNQSNCELLMSRAVLDLRAVSQQTICRRLTHRSTQGSYSCGNQKHHFRRRVFNGEENISCSASTSICSHSYHLGARSLHSGHSGPPASEPTIYALSTAPGKAAIAIIRISGTACTKVLTSLSHHSQSIE